MSTEHATRRELRLLRAYTLVSSVTLGALTLTAFRRAGERPRFEEIDVARINVIEKDGRVRLVIANEARSPAVVASGRTLGEPGGRPGMIFYNEEGDENGGLIFRGRRDSTGRVSAAGHLSFDQYGQDQVINLEYEEGDGRRQQGLTVLDRPPQNFFAITARRDSINRMPDGPAKEAARRDWALWQGAPHSARRASSWGATRAKPRCST